MKLSEVEIGRRVIYTPFEGCDESEKELGTITSKNKLYVFVKYDGDECSKSTWADDLEYI